MSLPSKFFELLDFPRFSRPNVLEIDVHQTADALRERLNQTSFMSYGQLWPWLEHIVRHGMNEDVAKTVFCSYQDGWKNKSIQQAALLIDEVIGNAGTWYRQGGKPKSTCGFFFKPSIKGIWFHNETARAVLINPRKGQRLTRDEARFLSRGIYELYCLPDPNNPKPFVLDLSAKPLGAKREAQIFALEEHEMVSLESFEHSLHMFLDAMALAGLAQTIPADADPINLFK